MFSWLLATHIVIFPPAFAQEIEAMPGSETIQEGVIDSPFVSISDPNYSKYREKVAENLPEGSFCAQFVNRMLLKRYGIFVFGDAWTMQIHKDNTAFLKMVWKLDESEFDRKNNLALYNAEDRVTHYKELYNVLDKEEDPQGVLGFVYKFSTYREQLAQQSPKNALAQTHVAYLAGKKNFLFTNNSDTTKTLAELITQKYGIIHDFEYAFLSGRVRLETKLEPGDSYYYQDYLIEENFRQVMHGSLLEVFLRKHRNNKVTPLLRPNSYSTITQTVRDSVGGAIN